MTSVIAQKGKSSHDRMGLILTAIAVLAGAWWLTNWAQSYLVVSTAASVMLALSAWRARNRRWWWTLAVLLMSFVAAAWRSSFELDSVGGPNEGESSAAALANSVAGRVAAEVKRSEAELRDAASRMLEVPPGTASIVTALESRLPSFQNGEASVVLSENGQPYGWAGIVRIRPELMQDAVGMVRNEFYVVQYAASARGSRRALVMRTIQAEAPASRLSRSLLGTLATRVGAEGFEPAEGNEAGAVLLTAGSDTAGWVRAASVSQAQSRLALEERTRVLGISLLGIALLVWLGLAWRHPSNLTQRLMSLAVVLAVVALAPLNALSNTAAVFNATYFFSGLGGPFTANLAALAVTGLVASLAVFGVTRSRRRPESAWVALPVTVICISLGPFVLRELARGITLPPRGVSATLWIGWEVALFLTAVAVLIFGAWSAQRFRRFFVLHASLASGLAAVSAMVAPIIWQAPGRFPQWYVLVWIVTTGALMISRRSRAFTLHVAFIAACGAATLVWASVSRKRVELAQRDVAALGAPDPGTIGLLERFAEQVSGNRVPATKADLLKLYVASELPYGGNPVELSVWRQGALEPDAELAIADLTMGGGGENAAILEALERGGPVIGQFASSVGIQLALAVPLDSQRVLSVVAAPRTRLIEEDPYAALLGLDVPVAVEPAYRLTVSQAEPGATLVPSWSKRGDELHGDWTVRAGTESIHTHVEVELRSLDALLARGALLVLLDLALLAVLWFLVATADGALRRWLRARTRRWRGSYRARLTLAIFVAFVVPSTAFAVWTYERLKAEDLVSRSLLVQETLRQLRQRDVLESLASGTRVELPLFWYRRAELSGVSNPLYEQLSPLGLFVDPVAAQEIVFGQESSTNRRVSVGPVPTLIGYRVTIDGLILATPARRSELTLERQQRDLLVLLALSLVLGALAALWVSGLAARALARPISALRRAARDVASGARDLPSLGSAPPPSEFATVYGTFRQMAVDLSDSRFALQAAQRRTEAVLRDVGSGVIAFAHDGRIILANPRAEQILGVNLVPGDTLSRGTEPLSAYVQDFLSNDNEPRSFDHEVRGRQVRSRLTRLFAGDGGAVLTIDDVTDLARAQRVFAWGEMARQIAHEIKNPLTPIRLGVQHVRRAYADARPGFSEILDRNVARILEEIDRLDEIARSFAKFGTHPIDAATSDVVDVTEVAEDVVNLERMGDSGVKWELQAEDQFFAHSNESELREVLLNVLENARHANAKRVRVRVTGGAATGESRVTVCVDDDGEGVPPDVMSRVFEPHFSTRTSGSGLGLAISRRLVESWGGSIRLTSPAGSEVSDGGRIGGGSGTRVEIALVAATPS